MAALKKKIVKKVSKKKPKKLALKKTVQNKKLKIKVKTKTKQVKKKVLKKKKVILKKKQPLKKLKRKNGQLLRHHKNPVLSPEHYSWQSMATFNPAAVYSGGRVHLFYRALGADGVSRIGYASSKDGLHFDVRLTYPVFIAQNEEEASRHWPYTSPARVYNPQIYTSGGGWGGCEDPRAVIIDGTLYLTFNMFNGWHSMRVAVSSIQESDLLASKWLWKNFNYLSRPGDRQKNWVLFPEKINGKFALIYNLDKGDPNRIHIAYMNHLSMDEAPTDTMDPQAIPDHHVSWHYRTRSPAAPPLRTKYGWLLLYHAMEQSDANRYKVGAMLLDLEDPEKVLYRAPAPILEPDFWYENDYKPGIVYASGAIIKDRELFVYYGGGDKYIGVATINLDELLEHMKKNQSVKLAKQKIFKTE